MNRPPRKRPYFFGTIRPVLISWVTASGFFLACSRVTNLGPLQISMSWPSSRLHALDIASSSQSQIRGSKPTKWPASPTVYARYSATNLALVAAIPRTGAWRYQVNGADRCRSNEGTETSVRRYSCGAGTAFACRTSGRRGAGYSLAWHARAGSGASIPELTVTDYCRDWSGDKSSLAKGTE
jgi:hypothetical protein